MSKQIDDILKVCIWRDGDWCFHDRLKEYTHKSDDFIVEDIHLHNFDDKGELSTYLIQDLIELCW